MAANAQLLVGYDGSPSAAGAIEIGALLLPGASARIAHVWSPPFANRDLRTRLWHRAKDLDELAALVEDEGRAEAERIARAGAVLAKAAGWQVEPVVERNVGDHGFALAQLAGRTATDAVVVGSRGLSGVRALMGSVSDAIVHASPAPILVVTEPLLEPEREAARSGPVLVGYDGSEGSARALDAAASLFGDRSLVAATAGEEGIDEGELGDVTQVTIAPRGVASSGRAIADALAIEAAERDAALIVVGSRGRSPGREMLLGSVAMAVLHHAHRPVLVVPPADRFAG